jgi:hypothetical protein
MKTRDPLRVDESYYINNDPNYSAFADAITDVGPAPCQKFECSNRDVCAAKMVECKAFRVWTNEGEDVYDRHKFQNRKGNYPKPIIESTKILLQPIK